MEERGRWLASGLFGHHLRTAGVVRLQAKVVDQHFFLLWPGLALTLACRPGCVPIPVRLAAAMAGPAKGVGKHAGCAGARGGCCIGATRSGECDGFSGWALPIVDRVGHCCEIRQSDGAIPRRRRM